jgi:hypothetical protein
MKLTKYQLIRVKVNAPGDSVKFSAETDKLYQRVQGIYVSLPNDNSHFGSTLDLRIAEQEIFPDGFETKLLATSQHVATGDRFAMFDTDEIVEAAGSHVEGRFTDGGYTTGVTFPYAFNIYLKLKNDK